MSARPLFPPLPPLDRDGGCVPPYPDYQCYCGELVTLDPTVNSFQHGKNPEARVTVPIIYDVREWGHLLDWTVMVHAYEARGVAADG